jgi:beta-mannosidase
LDYRQQPKPAYETVQRLLNPVLISIEYPRRKYQPGDRLCANVWIVNDMASAISGCHLEVTLWDGAGQPLNSIEQSVEIPAASAKTVSCIDWELPEASGWHLTCLLNHDGRTLTTNTYDLAIHDDIRPTIRQRLWARLTNLVVPK